MENVRYVIVGGGLAGVAAADAIRRRDKTGRVVVVCGETHPPYDRVPLSKDYLLQKIDRDQIFLRRPRFYERNKIELWLSQAATGLDVGKRILTLAGGQQIAFDRLLLATGGRPRTLQLPGADLQGLYYLRRIEDAEAIQQAVQGARRAVVIGGGFIGCELAAAFVTLGLQTTVVEVTPAVLSLVVDPETSGFIGAYLERQGVVVLANAAATGFVGEQGRVKAVSTSTGEALDADVVVIGVGIMPNTELAAAAGLAVDNGVVVNEYLEAANGVYAAGDIARYYNPVLGRHHRVEHYDVALQHGRIAGSNMTGEHQAYEALPYFFSTMGAINLNVVGDMSRREHTIRRGELGLQPGFAQFYFADGLLQAVLSVNRNGTLMQAARERILTRRPVQNPAAFADESQDVASL
jgi:3-phenylpropionate/trans-cinnamate dioxygenase ferredoxin reductase subunit